MKPCQNGKSFNVSLTRSENSISTRGRCLQDEK